MSPKLSTQLYLHGCGLNGGLIVCNFQTVFLSKCDGKRLQGRMKRKVWKCYLSLELFVKLYLGFDAVPLKIKLQSENL